MNWKPIEDLSANWSELGHESLHALAGVWKEQRDRMKATQSYDVFLAKMRRKIAIETGIIERLYTIDRGVTQLLIEHGIDVSLMQHGTTDKPPVEIVNLIRDHESAIDRVFDFVGSQRDLSVSFIKQLHQLLTRNQDYTEGIDQFGRVSKVQLIRGDWKRLPNNPLRPDGAIHHYCPPEQVSSEMDRLIEWHLEHQAKEISPEVEAAWLHHRFTQIHPFQDGNGRVARNLASLIFIKAGWFPLVVLDEQSTEDEARKRYIDALEHADQGDLKPLVDLFAESQRRTFLSSLSLAEDAIQERQSLQTMLDATIGRIRAKQTARIEDAILRAQQNAEVLYKDTIDKMQGIQREVDVALRGIIPNSLVRLDSADAQDERAGYYRYQIIQTARQLGYYANLSNFRSWVRLAIRPDDTQTEILISFHVLGHQPRGVMIASACAYRRYSSDDGDTSQVVDLQPLSQTPFEFTYQEEEEALQKRFAVWLDDVVIIGIDYWRRSI